jgi:hypothetical protein
MLRRASPHLIGFGTGITEKKVAPANQATDHSFLTNKHRRASLSGVPNPPPSKAVVVGLASQNAPSRTAATKANAMHAASTFKVTVRSTMLSLLAVEDDES